MSEWLGFGGGLPAVVAEGLGGDGANGDGGDAGEGKGDGGSAGGLWRGA